MVADGDICHVEGGIGGVSPPPPEVERLRFPELDGGVPIANCTVGGEIELISQFELLLRRFDGFMLIGCDRGIPVFDADCLFECETINIKDENEIINSQFG